MTDERRLSDKQFDDVSKSNDVISGDEEDARDKLKKNITVSRGNFTIIVLLKYYSSIQLIAPCTVMLFPLLFFSHVEYLGIALALRLSGTNMQR